MQEFVFDFIGWYIIAGVFFWLLQLIVPVIHFLIYGDK